MSTVPPIRRPFSARALAAAVLIVAASVRADQTPGNAPYGEKEPGFFHRASDNVGSFFRRLFKTDEERPPQQPPPKTSRSRSRGSRYNLDEPPAELRTIPGVSSPDDGTTVKEGGAGTSKSRFAANPPDRESTLVEEPPKPKVKAKSQKSAASAESKTSVVPTDATPRPKTRKPTAPAPDAADAGTVLYSNPGTAEAKQPEPTFKAPTESAPTPPKVAPESPTVLTGSKTGKSGRVKSPYAPYSELDVTGLPSGSLALDPTTQKVFRIP